MNCKYSKINENDSANRHYLYCKIHNNEMCPLIRYCSKIKDFINIDAYDKKCKYFIKGETMKREFENKVLFEKKHKLYIEINDTIITVENPFEYIPEFVKLVKVKSEYYVDGFQPKYKKATSEGKSDE